MRKRLVRLFLLGLILAVPLLAFPPQCSCSFCYSNPGTTSCTLITGSGNTVVTCGYYIPRYCEGPA